MGDRYPADSRRPVSRQYVQIADPHAGVIDHIDGLARQNHTCNVLQPKSNIIAQLGYRNIARSILLFCKSYWDFEEVVTQQAG